MSRYQVDKALREVILDKEKQTRFLDDPQGFLEGRDLTPVEREAIAKRDYATLYSLGAHPFILFGWLGTISREPVPKIVGEYCERVRPYGYPDFST